MKQAALIVSNLEDGNRWTPPTSRTYSFFLFESSRLIEWSSNDFVPTAASVAETFSIKLLKAGNGNYLAKKWKLKDSRFLVGVVPLIRNYSITNDYLKTAWNERVFPSSNFDILEPDANLGLPVCIRDECVFRVSFLQNELTIHRKTKATAVVLISFSIIVLMVIVYRYIRKIPSPEIQLIALYAAFVVVRYGMVNLNFPADLVRSELFNPQVFASSRLNVSLGDLILNEIVLLILCVHLFRNYKSFTSLKFIYRKNALAWVLSVVSALCVLYAALFPFVVIQTLYNNSSIILDLSQSLRFDQLRVFATIAVLLSGICSFLFSHTFIRLLIADGARRRVLISFFIGAILFSVINIIVQQSFLSSLLLGTVYFLLVYFLKLYTSLRQLSFATFVYLFVSIFFLSTNGAYAHQSF